MCEARSEAVVDLIDASYDLTEATVPWATRIVKGLMGLTASQTGAAFHFASGYEDGVFRVRDMKLEVEFCPGPFRLGNVVAGMQAPGAVAERMLGRTQATLAAQVSGLGSDLARLPGWRECWPRPIVDSLGFVSRDPDGEGFVACVGLDHVGSLTPRETRLFTRLATHVAAGDRLRRAKHRRPLDEAEAILTPSGTVLHAREAAKDKRDPIDEGRRRRDEARNTRHDPEKALEVWKGLVAGRWSLVDHFDSDGKRFLLVMKNAPHVDRRADLTPRERRVAALAAMGHRDKEIAYVLGLSMASVTAAFHRARAKLGVRTRAELAAVWRRGVQA